MLEPVLASGKMTFASVVWMASGQDAARGSTRAIDHAMRHPPLRIDEQDIDGRQIHGEEARRGHQGLSHTGDRLRRANSGQAINVDCAKKDRALKPLIEEPVDHLY